MLNPYLVTNAFGGQTFVKCMKQPGKMMGNDIVAQWRVHAQLKCILNWFKTKQCAVQKIYGRISEDRLTVHIHCSMCFLLPTKLETLSLMLCLLTERQSVLNEWTNKWLQQYALIYRKQNICEGKEREGKEKEGEGKNTSGISTGNTPGFNQRNHSGLDSKRISWNDSWLFTILLRQQLWTKMCPLLIHMLKP